MARMANAECSVCHYIHPKNRTQERAVTQFSGFSMPMPFVSRGSVRQYYRRKRIRVCENCLPAFDQSIRRRQTIVASLVVGVLIVLFLPGLLGGS